MFKALSRKRNTEKQLHSIVLKDFKLSVTSTEIELDKVELNVKRGKR